MLEPRFHADQRWSRFPQSLPNLVDFLGKIRQNMTLVLSSNTQFVNVAISMA